jgi:Fuc2NAc and GlcNAc transferase
MLVIFGLYLIWMINLYNFMDGSNGMAGSQAVFAGWVLAWLFFRAGEENTALLCVLLAMVSLGFLPWNLGKAKVFMGDVASGTLGFVIGALLIYGVMSGSILLAVAWLVMLVFVCDSTLTLFARVLKGERWYNPHKQHLYQRLISSGWPHGRVLTLYQLINLVLVMPAIAVAVNYPASATVIAFVVTGALGLGWLLVKQKLGVLATAG